MQADNVVSGRDAWATTSVPPLLSDLLHRVETPIDKRAHACGARATFVVSFL